MVADDLIGKSIGGYDILDVVGRGGMATVYRAQQKSMNRVVAIKVLPEQYINDDTYIQRFTQEVEIVARLEHRNIVPVYDYGEFEGRPYIVMRYMSAGSVDDLLANGPLEIEQIVNIYDQIAPALDYAHSKNVLHRDIKPSNVLLDDDGGAYLTDFGIARVLGEAGSKGITTQGVVGTPSYMSPEQAQGQPLDNRSDTYAMGIMLFELATGRRPFESDTPYSIAVMQVTTPPPSPRSLNPTLSMAVEEVIYKALKKKREERYPHSIALSEALKRALNKPVSSIHDTQPGGFQRPQQQPVGGGVPIPNAAPNPAPQFIPPPAPPPSSVMQPPARPMTPAPSYPRRRKVKTGNVWMSAALGGVLGCGLLAVLIVIALVVITTLANRSATLPDATTVPADGDSEQIAPDAGAAEEGGFTATLDATSQAAFNALIPGSPTLTPLVAPVGVREDIPLSQEAAATAAGLVYFAERDGNFDIFKLNLATGSEIRLTFDDAVDSYPQVSPDGGHIVFQSDRDGDFDIYTLDINGENLVKLTDNDLFDRLPAWSPNGEWIVFSSDTRDDGNYDLYQMERDGSDLHQIFTNGERNSHPRFSPDGRSVVFTTGSDADATTWDIGLLDLESGSIQKLKADNIKDWSPSFSPDGERILFLTTGPTGNASGQAAIAQMNREGGNSQILYDGIGFEWGAAYSPTGTLFAFTTLAANTAHEEIFLMDSSGTRIEQLTENGAQGPSWIPN